jgi:hypothetical protein
VVRAADGDADVVEKRAYALLPDVRRKFVVLRFDDIARENSGDLNRRE